jgi:hypothetical protein
MLSTGGMPSRDVALVRVDGGSRQPGVEEGGRGVCPHQKQFRYEGVVRADASCLSLLRHDGRGWRRVC